MTTNYAQRWAEQQVRWVPHRHVVDTRKLEVELVSESDAKAFVCTHHYSGSYPASRLRVGLYQAGNLVGVAVYSEPANPNTIPSWTKQRYTREQGVELGRFVLLDEVGFNAESFFWARARRLLRAHKPNVRVILAYSDPVRREALDGQVTLPGHIGQIYQATNASYQGRASPRTLYLDPDGKVVSARAISKIASSSRGERYARARLEGASQTTQREGDAALLSQPGELRRLRHNGNHVYLWGVTGRDPVPPGEKAPDAIDPVQLGLL